MNESELDIDDLPNLPDDNDTDEFEWRTDPEWLCVNCGQREAVLNQCCAMCTELRPDLMGYAG